MAARLAPGQHGLEKGQACRLAGKGRGVVASEEVALGDLLACIRAAVVLHGPVDEAPEAPLLVPQLMSLRVDALPWAARAAILHLADGSDGATSQLPLPFWDAASAAGSASAADAADAAGATRAAAGHRWPPCADTLARLVKLNAFADDYEDLASAAARGAAGRSVAGLWPAFSYHNHSCMPNTVHYVVNDLMVVRAVTDVGPGEEITVSYLGREEFAPAPARQAVLRERWGFECTCERCTVEAAAPRELSQTITACYARDLRPAFLQAAEAGDWARVSEIAGHLRGVEATAREAIKQYAPGAHPATATFMHAALYDMFELIYGSTQLPGPGSDPLPDGSGGGGPSASLAHEAIAALSRCLSIVDSVSRGAELHVFLACTLLERALAMRGADSPQAAAALQLVGQASEARYGKNLPMDLWERLQRASSELAPEFL